MRAATSRASWCLLGGGMANLQVLADLAAKPLPEMRIILVAPHPRSIYPGMLAGMVAGRYSADECAIPLEPLVRRAGIRWLQRDVTALDTRTQILRLDDGSSQHYDWLSINTGPVQNRDQMDRTLPGAREHGLFVHPMETFAALWPRVCDLSQTRALRVAVIGSGTAAMELALAVRQRMPDSAVTWVAGPLADTLAHAPHPSAADTVTTRLTHALKAQRITVLYDTALSLKADEVQLGCGARLACDVPLIAMEGQTPAWLADSGLALERPRPARHRPLPAQHQPPRGVFRHRQQLGAGAQPARSHHRRPLARQPRPRPLPALAVWRHPAGRRRLGPLQCPRARAELAQGLDRPTVCGPVLARYGLSLRARSVRDHPLFWAPSVMTYLQQMAYIVRCEAGQYLRWRKLRWAAWGVALLPSLYALIYLSSLWDPAANTRALTVALVNLDDGVDYKDHIFNVGGIVTTRLKSDHHFSYIDLRDADEAKRQVRQGTLAFALIIPKDFSSNAIPGAQPGDGKLVVYTAEGNSYETGVHRAPVRHRAGPQRE